MQQTLICTKNRLPRNEVKSNKCNKLRSAQEIGCHETKLKVINATNFDLHKKIDCHVTKLMFFSNYKFTSKQKEVVDWQFLFVSVFKLLRSLVEIKI